MVASVPKVANAEATTRASAVVGKRLHVQVGELHCYASIYFPSTKTHTYDMGTGAYRHKPQHETSSWDMNEFIFLFFPHIFNFQLSG